MSHRNREMHRTAKRPKREEFPDGSALVTHPDGSLEILESKLARSGALREIRPVSYNDPPPAPPEQQQH